MECFKCSKEMTREDGGPTLTGVEVVVSSASENEVPNPETVEYFNKQLGKHSDGTGSCHVVICFECYIDGLVGK